MGKKSRVKRERQEEEGKNPSRKTIVSQPKTIAEAILLFLVYGATYLLVLTPFVVNTRYFFPYVGPKGLYLMALIEIAFFSWIILAFLNPKYRPKKNAVLLALIGYITILILATLFGADPLRSFWSKFERMSGLLMWLHLFGFFIVSSSVFKRKHWERIFLTSLGVAVFICILFFTDTESALTAKGGSTLGNSSFLATYLLFNIYFAIYLFCSFLPEVIRKIKAKEEALSPVLKTTLVVVSFIFMLVVLGLSNGDAAIISCIGGFGLIFLFWLAFQIRRLWIRKIGKILVVLGFIVYVSTVFLLLYPESFVQKYYLNFRGRARPIVWQSSWEGFKERPILGWGPQNFGFVFQENLQPWIIANDKPNFDQAHNVVIDNLVDAGALGFIGYLSLFGSVFWVLWKRHRKSKLAFWTAAIFSTVLIAHFTQNLTVFDMPASFLMLFFVIGFSGSLALNDKEQNDKIQTKRISPTVVILSILLFGFCFNYFVYKPMLADQGVIKTLASQTHIQRMEAYEQALHSSPMGIYQTRTHLIGRLLQRAEKGDAIEEEFDFISQELERSLSLSPLDYDSRLAAGKLYNFYGSLFDRAKLIRAEEVLNEAIQLSPINQRAYWEMSKTYFLLSMPDESISYAEQAIAIDPNLVYSYLFYVNLLNIQNKHELAIEKAREALIIVPEWQARKIKPSFKENLEDILGIEDLGVDK